MAALCFLIALCGLAIVICLLGVVIALTGIGLRLQEILEVLKGGPEDDVSPDPDDGERLPGENERSWPRAA